MKTWLLLACILFLGLTACSPSIDSDQPDLVAPQEGSEPQSASPSDQNQPPGDAPSGEFIEQSSGSLTARIFSAQEATINQQQYSLQGWVNRAAVISANENITVTDSEETFSLDLQLENGPNLIEVIISDQDGNEVRFEIILYVEE